MSSAHDSHKRPAVAGQWQNDHAWQTSCLPLNNVRTEIEEPGSTHADSTELR